MPGQPLFFGPLLYLRTVPALDRLSASELAAVAQHAEEEVFPAGTALLYPGRPREAFFVLVQGRVSVRGPMGREEVLGPGEPLGFLHLLARSEEDMEAVALWETVTLRVDWDAYLDVCEQHFPILEAHMESLARSCQEALDRARRDAAASPIWSSPGPPERPARGGEAPDSPERPSSQPPAGHPRAGADLDSSRALDLVQKLQVLHRCPAFPSSNMDALGELARHLEEVRIQPGEELWREGDPSDSFLLVASGRLLREGPDGRWREELGPGEVVGRFEALAGLPRRSPLDALRPTVALRVRKEVLLDILEDHFTMAVDFTAELARELIRLRKEGPPSPPEEDVL